MVCPSDARTAASLFHRMISSFKSEAATKSPRGTSRERYRTSAHCLASSRLLSCPDRLMFAALRFVFVANSGSSTIVVADSQLSGHNSLQCTQYKADTPFQPPGLQNTRKWHLYLVRKTSPTLRPSRDRDRLRAMSVPSQKLSVSKMSRVQQYWLPGYGLSRHIVLGHIQYFLGPSASVRPYSYQVTLP